MMRAKRDEIGRFAARRCVAIGWDRQQKGPAKYTTRTSPVCPAPGMALCNTTFRLIADRRGLTSRC